MRAAGVAGLFSGAPSTVHALVTGRSVVAAARAAGALLGRPTLPRGVLAHTVLTAGWTTVLVAVLPRRRAAAWGALAGLAIGALDLGVVGRRVPAIAALPTGPQLLDHLVFGALVGAVLSDSGARHGAPGVRRPGSG